MKISKIVRKVEELRQAASTFPVSHATCRLLEWELWQEVLHDDALGKGSPAKSAAALETTKIDFDRSGGH